ncbi:hypothetical protein [Mesorhizobium sp. Z1-4]|uniref:hypothetical protein n=1 Tax=Mesorhizobium sp. Z1-4 TaxID=2448478 RepID=UPI000FDCA935|nr:hypothetical protein [Mesorhizobium sp. Z1-4]
MTAGMCAALREAEAGPLIKGRAGWGRHMGPWFSTRQVDALVNRGYLAIEGNAAKWGARAPITDAGRQFLAGWRQA